MNHVTHLLSSTSISIFSLEISNFHYIRKYRYTSNFNTWFLIIFTFFESLKVFIINMFAVLMTSAKIATLGFLKEKVFWSKVNDVKISVQDVTNKILSRDSNYIKDVVIWSKFGNYSISLREVIITSILEGFDQKKQFFWGVFLVQVQ